jgi:ATP-dependent helicase/DNAse subunit B
VDRIDRLPDGSQIIIDYKSGVSRVQDWLGERPAKPQLLLYGIAAPDAAAALAFAQIRPRDSRFVGLGRVAAAPGIATDIEKAVQERMPATDWESLNACWRDNLERLATEFLDGDARVDPLANDSCTWCGLQPLCRIGATEAEPA